MIMKFHNLLLITFVFDSLILILIITFGLFIVVRLAVIFMYVLADNLS